MIAVIVSIGDACKSAVFLVDKVADNRVDACPKKHGVVAKTKRLLELNASVNSLTKPV
jgi:hypothetical protein